MVGSAYLPSHNPCQPSTHVRGKSPFHILHYLPRLPPWIQGGSRHRYCQPLGQAITTACGLEGGVPVPDLPGPAQGVWRLGQVQVPGNPGGIRRRPQGQETTHNLLALTDHGGAGGWLLQDSVWGRERCDAGRPAVPHNFQCGGGHGRPALGTRRRGESGSTGGNRTGGPASGRTILRQQRHGHLVGPRLAPGRIYRPGRPLWQGGSEYKCREDCQHGLPPLPGDGRKQNTRGIQEETHGRGEVIKGAAAQAGGMRGVWRTAGGRVNVKSSDDSIWESGGAKTPMDTPEIDRDPDI